MNKADLIDKIAKDAKISKTASGKALDSLVDGVTKALKKGDRVALVGFGTFTVSKRKARVGRNPQTGEQIEIKARKVARFRPGKKLVLHLHRLDHQDPLAGADLLPLLHQERRDSPRHDGAHFDRPLQDRRTGSAPASLRVEERHRVRTSREHHAPLPPASRRGPAAPPRRDASFARDRGLPDLSVDRQPQDGPVAASLDLARLSVEADAEAAAAARRHLDLELLLPD